MSRGRESGAVRRTGVLAALIAASVVLVLPLSAATDSSAEFEAAESGYAVRISTGATEAELESTGLGTVSLLSSVVAGIAPVFSTLMLLEQSGPVHAEDATLGSSYRYDFGDGASFDTDLVSESYHYKDCEYVDFSITYVFGDEMQLRVYGLQSKINQAATAVFDEFDTEYAVAGDRLTFSGTFSQTCLYSMCDTYGHVGGDNYLTVSIREYDVERCEYDVEAVFEHGSSGIRDTVRFTGDGTSRTVLDYDLDYGKDLSLVEEGDKYTADFNEKIVEYDDSAAVTVGGRDYPLTFSHEDYAMEGNAFYSTSEDISLVPEYMVYGSSEHVSYDGTYGAMKAAYDDLKDGTDPGDDGMMYVYIGIGVAAVAIVALSVLFLMRRKRPSRKKKNGP